MVILAKEKFGIRARTLEDKNMRFIPFSAKTRMSGVDYDGVEIRKGAADSMRDYVLQNGGAIAQNAMERSNPFPIRAERL